MPIQMFNWVSRPEEEFQVNAAAAGLVLVVMTLAMNATSYLFALSYAQEPKMVENLDGRDLGLDAAPVRYKSEVRNLSFYYGAFSALKNINMVLHEKQVTALIGPSGCGKSTFLRCFNRMHDLYPGNRYVGDIILHPDNVNILSRSVDPIEVRMRISMVFRETQSVSKIHL